KGVPQPEAFHPEGDVWEHTLRMLDLLPPHAPVELAWAALLHDCGKPRTITYADRIRFHYHEKVGEQMVHGIGRRLRFPNRRIERIAWLVGNHMRLAAFPDMREGKRKRFSREPDFPLLVELGRLDSLASHGDTSVIEWIRQYLSHEPPAQPLPPPLITGDDLKALGLPPGPAYRELLQMLHERQIEGVFSTREAGLALARKLIEARQPPDE
ncbi:MAG TPA: HD domain-containing protein, partial [Candidatus Hydrogenedentes bacterium]|nr:HD domain-containing protein [Candidatus Hydrogenedentota bacterium]